MAFSYKSTLTSHRRKVHRKVKPYKCDDCESTFYQPSHLAKHKCKCDVCGKIFTHPGSLIKHKFAHTTEKPYPCEICKASFNNPLTHKKSRKHLNNIYLLVNEREKKKNNEKSLGDSLNIEQKTVNFTNETKEIKTEDNKEDIKEEIMPFNNPFSSFVDCIETIKAEDIKEETKEVENIDNYFEDDIGLLIKPDDIECEIKEEDRIDDESLPFEQVKLAN
jgi:hypothetical protein